MIPLDDNTTKQTSAIMADAAEIEELKQVIKSLVIPWKAGATLKDIEKDYLDLEGSKIPFSKFGFANLKSFLQSNHFHDEFIFGCNNDGYEVIRPKMDEATAHIQKLVQEQIKPKKKTRKDPVRTPFSFKPSGLRLSGFNTGNNFNSRRSLPQTSNGKSHLNQLPPQKSTSVTAKKRYGNIAQQLPLLNGPGTSSVTANATLAKVNSPTLKQQPNTTCTPIVQQGYPSWSSKGLYNRSSPVTVSTGAAKPVQFGMIPPMAPYSSSKPMANRIVTFPQVTQARVSDVTALATETPHTTIATKPVSASVTHKTSPLGSMKCLTAALGTGRARAVSTVRHPVPSLPPFLAEPCRIVDDDIFSLLKLRCLQSIYHMSQWKSANEVYDTKDFLSSYEALYPTQSSSLNSLVQLHGYIDLTGLLKQTLENVPNPLIFVSGSDNASCKISFCKDQFLRLVLEIERDVRDLPSTSVSIVLQHLISIEVQKKIIANDILGGSQGPIGRRILDWFFIPFVPVKEGTLRGDSKINYQTLTETLAHGTNFFDEDVVIYPRIQDRDLMQISDPSNDELTPIDAVVLSDIKMFVWHDLVISSVTSPDHVSVIRSVDQWKFEDITRTLNQFYTNCDNRFKIPRELWKDGLTCVVKHGQNFLRGVMTEVEDASFRVKMIDTGASEDLKPDDKNITPFFFKKGLVKHARLAVATSLLAVIPPISRYMRMSNVMATEDPLETIIKRGYPSQASSFLVKNYAMKDLTGCFFRSKSGRYYSFLCHVSDNDGGDEYLHEALIEKGLGERMTHDACIDLLRGEKSSNHILWDVIVAQLRHPK